MSKASELLKPSANESFIKAGLSYEEYRGLIEQLLLAGKTTGENQSPEMVEYTRINVQRMNKLDNKVVVDEALLEVQQQISKKWYWIVFTEAWSSDAAENLPVLAKLAEASANIDLKIFLRDEEKELIKRFLKEDTSPVPKLLCLSQNELTEIGSWGPRPKPVEEIITDCKIDAFNTQEELIQKIHHWYAADKGNTLQKEMTALMRNWMDK